MKSIITDIFRETVYTYFNLIQIAVFHGKCVSNLWKIVGFTKKSWNYTFSRNFFLLTNFNQMFLHNIQHRGPLTNDHSFFNISRICKKVKKIVKKVKSKIFFVPFCLFFNMASFSITMMILELARFSLKTGFPKSRILS